MMSIIAKVDTKLYKDQSDNLQFEMLKTQKNKRLGW
jgi:hypothetical protein